MFISNLSFIQLLLIVLLQHYLCNTPQWLDRPRRYGIWSNLQLDHYIPFILSEITSSHSAALSLGARSDHFAKCVVRCCVVYTSVSIPTFSVPSSVFSTGYHLYLYLKGLKKRDLFTLRLACNAYVLCFNMCVS